MNFYPVSLGLVTTLLLSVPASSEIVFQDGQCLDDSSQKPAWHEHLLAPCSDLEKKTLLNQDLIHLDLTGSRATRANLSQSRIHNSSLIQVIWKEGRFDQGSCRTSKFSKSDMRGFKTKDSRWSDCELDEVDLRGSYFYQTKMTGGSLKGARLSFSGLILSTFENVDLRGADLSGALVSMTTWRDCRFDASTKLPFSEAKALELGMRKVTD